MEYSHERRVHSTSHLLNILLHHKIQIFTRSRKAAETCNHGNRHLLRLVDGLLDPTIHDSRYYDSLS